MNANWKLPKTQKSLHSLLHNPKEGDFWQADHIKAVEEGGGNSGLDNLRTLCTFCHQVETEQLRGRLKLMDKSR
jgi:5-methylcytosine-specific restriction endonuclease McrA